MSAEFEDNLEQLQENLDDGFEAADEAIDDIAEDISEEATGETSAEAATNALSSSEGRKSLLKNMTIYDAMLMASALSIALACGLMFLELTSFGGLFFQWRTGEAFVEPLQP